MDRNFVNRFLKGSIATSFGTMATVAFHFVSITLMTRYVGQRELGIYFLILAIANGGKTLGNLGLDLTLVKFLSSEHKSVQQNAFVATIGVRLVIMAVLSLLIISFGSLMSPLFAPEIADFIVHIPVLFVLMSFRELFFFLLQGLNRFGMYAAVQTASAILKCVLIVLLSNSLDLAMLIYIEFAMLIASIAIQFAVIPFKELIPEHVSVDWRTTQDILRFGFPLYINSLLVYVSNFGGTFIVGLFLTPISIAAYEVAAKIPQGVNRLLQSFSTVYFPTASSLFATRDLDSVRKLVNKSLVLLASGTFAAVLLSLLFSREIIGFLFTSQYLEVQPTFVLLMLAICLQLLAITMGYSLVAANVPHKSTRINIVGISVEFAMSLILVPLIGYVGVAISFIIQTLITQVLCFYYLRQENVTIDTKMLLRPYLILGATSFGYLLLQSDSVVTKAAFFWSYIGLSVLFVPDCQQAITYFWTMMQQVLHSRERAQSLK